MSEPIPEGENRATYLNQLCELARIQFNILSKDPTAFLGDEAEYDSETGRILFDSSFTNMHFFDPIKNEVSKDWFEIDEKGVIYIVNEQTIYAETGTKEDEIDKDKNASSKQGSLFDDFLNEIEYRRVISKKFVKTILNPQTIDQGTVKQITYSDNNDGNPLQVKEVDIDIHTASKEFMYIDMHWFNFYFMLRHNIAKVGTSEQVETFLSNPQVAQHITIFAFNEIKNKLKNGWLKEQDYKLTIDSDIEFTDTMIIPMIGYTRIHNEYNQSTGELIINRSKVTIPVNLSNIQNIYRTNDSDDFDNVLEMLDLQQKLFLYADQLERYMAESEIEEVLENYLQRFHDLEVGFIGEVESLVIPAIHMQHIPGINCEFRSYKRSLNTDGSIKYEVHESSMDKPSPQQLLFLMNFIRPQVR